MTELDYCPWLYWSRAGDEDRARQADHQRSLRERGVAGIGARTFVSPLAALYPTSLSIGHDSYVAAHVYLTGDVRLGDHSTLNPHAVVRGTVRLGDGVRVGAYACLLGFNHTMEPDRPVYQQPVTARGITVGDDVWIGSHAILLDGVSVGDHSVIGAGAVVTKDVPQWSVMVGNPARRVRDRRDRSRSRAAGLADRLERFAGRAREQAPALLDRYRLEDRPGFTNQPGAAPTVRATCDAVEIADLLLSGPPPSVRRDELVAHLAGRQDPASGLVPEYGEAQPASLDAPSAYHLLSVGYALDLLGTGLRTPIEAVRAIGPDALVSTLDKLPWADRAWHAGAWIDHYATGLHWNRRLFDLDGPLDTLLGWLLTHQDPWSGLWGTPGTAEGRRQPVNGYYRLTRGSFAQFGIPVPRPGTTVDTVLAHTRDGRFFADGRGTACDVLDVIHPLWLCGAQTRYRRTDVHAWARHRLGAALDAWHQDAGFAFSPVPTVGTEHRPSLMGTEMWLAIIWLLADVLGESGALGYTPRGVHRPTR